LMVAGWGAWNAVRVRGVIGCAEYEMMEVCGVRSGGRGVRVERSWIPLRAELMAWSAE